MEYLKEKQYIKRKRIIIMTSLLSDNKKDKEAALSMVQGASYL